METSLLNLELHIAAPLLFKVVQHLAQHGLQLCLRDFGRVLVETKKAFVGYVESCSVAVYRARCGLHTANLMSLRTKIANIIISDII